jgi:Protein of unknown function (DUF559)
VSKIDDGYGRRSCSRALADLAARQHGVVSLAQLRAVGLGARGAQHRAGLGALHRVHRGVYAVGHRLLTPDGARMAAVLACGSGAVLSHRSAAAAWGLRPTSRTHAEVTTTRRVRGDRPGIQVHHAHALPAQDTTTLRGIPITSVARTLADLAAVLGPAALERAVHQAEVLRLLDARALRDAARGRPGAKALARILEEPDPGDTHRGLEERFLALCRTGGLPLPRMNTHVHLADRLIEVDALWPRERLVVELDGRKVHHTARAFEDDRRRDSALAAEGYVVIRLTWRRITNEAGAVAAECQHTLQQRRRPVTGAGRA